MSKKLEKNNFIFFGTPEYAVFVLEELKKKELLPSIIITAPNRPAGRGLTLTPPPVKIWAEKNNIAVLQPEKLDAEFINKLRRLMEQVELFIVAAYGKIIPKEVLDIPKCGILNVHPSLLPKYRGPSPLEAPILNEDKETGVTIILLDEKMDHGPIITQEKIDIGKKCKDELGEILFRKGGQILVDVIPKWIAGKIKAKEQDHSKATFTKKITKQDGLIDLNDNAKINWAKFCAYYGWPGTFFFMKKNGKKIRVKITEAEFENGEFIIKRVIPEGKKEIPFSIFLK